MPDPVDPAFPPFDALLPPAMARRAEEAGMAKVAMPLPRMVLLGVLAGAFIGLGAMFSTVVTASSGLPFGVNRLLGGLVFCLGLVLVVVGGAELFTGNTLVVMALASRRVTLAAVARAWAVVYLANFVGAGLTAAAVFASRQHTQGDGVVGRRMLEIAVAKVSLPFWSALVLGILANALVCLAVWLSLAARSVTDKIAAVILPITAFVAAGFEHSIANMYFLPVALLVKRWGVDDLPGGPDPGLALDRLTWARFLWSNLLPVTMGNVIGGAVLVGLIYWAVYLRSWGGTAGSAPLDG